MNLQDFLSFKKMLTPVIIKILFWIGIVMSILIGLGTILGGLIGGLSENDFGMVFGGICTGPLIILLGIVSVRIYSELLILAFQIHETLVDIKDLLARR